MHQPVNGVKRAFIAEQSIGNNYPYVPSMGTATSSHRRRAAPTTQKKETALCRLKSLLGFLISSRGYGGPTQTHFLFLGASGSVLCPLRMLRGIYRLLQVSLFPSFVFVFDPDFPNRKGRVCFSGLFVC